jgi:predicted O-methyltransferase YrrM
MNKDEALLKAKIAYTNVARRIGGALARVGVMGLAPPRRDRRLRHWAYSLTLVHDSLALAEMDVPWWTYRATDVVEAWLAARRKPIRVFEYGSGASTFWLARRADEVHSVEHDRGFAERMGPKLLQLPNVHFRVVEPERSSAPRVPSAKEGHGGLDFSDYVATVEKVGGPFALIVIDGRAREACLAAAIPHLEDDGIIVFDNTRRHRYRAAIAGAGVHQRALFGLVPSLPYPDETSILSLRS